MENNKAPISVFILFILWATYLVICAYNKAEKYKEQCVELTERNEAYANYYAATEEFLDSVQENPDVQLEVLITTNKAGDKYLNNKFVVDSLCYGILP